MDIYNNVNRRRLFSCNTFPRYSVFSSRHSLLVAPFPTTLIGHFGSRNWSLGGNSFGFGRHVHCQILAALQHFLWLHAATIATHVIYLQLVPSRGWGSTLAPEGAARNEGFCYTSGYTMSLILSWWIALVSYVSNRFEHTCTVQKNS
jgi:hypothetical protein